MKKKQTKQTIFIDDAMEIAKRDKITIYRWIKSKKIIAYKERSGYRWNISQKSLQNYMSARRKGVKKKWQQKES